MGYFARRRQFLAQSALGIGALRWPGCWIRRGCSPRRTFRARIAAFDLAPRPPQQPPRARAMISLFMHGGPSHVDLLDPKPELTKRSGNDYPGEVVYSFANRASKKLFGSPWKFAKHGQCGTEVSELLPHLAEHRRRRRRDPLDAHRHQRPRVVDLVHEHRQVRSPGGRRLGSWLTLRAGLRKPGPAGLRRA